MHIAERKRALGHYFNKNLTSVSFLQVDIIENPKKFGILYSFVALTWIPVKQQGNNKDV